MYLSELSAIIIIIIIEIQSNLFSSFGEKASQAKKQWNKQTKKPYFQIYNTYSIEIGRLKGLFF